MLWLTTPEQIPIFKSIYGTRILKKFDADPKNFDADPKLFYTKRTDPKSRIGTKHETVPEKFRGMIITSSCGTVPH